LLKVAHVGEANTDVEYVLVDVMVVVVVDVTVAVTLELMVTWLVAVDVFVKEVVFVLVAVFDTVFRTAVTVACGTPAQEQALTYLAVLLQDSKVRLSRPVGLATSKGKWPKALAWRLEGASVWAASATASGKWPMGAARAASSKSAVGMGSGWASLLRAESPLPAHGWIVLVVEVVMVGVSVSVTHSVAVNERVLVEVSRILKYIVLGLSYVVVERSLVWTMVEVVLTVFHTVLDTVNGAGVVVTRLAK
jgi:hypothetical protein